jgi:hypothetical protein
MWLIALLVIGAGVPADDEKQTRPTVEEMRAQPAAMSDADARGPAVPVRIDVRNEMSKRFRLVEARVVLDETEVVHQTAASGQELERTFSALETPVRPGEHALTATLVYEGRNRGPFSYLDNYRYKVQTSYPFDLESGKQSATIQVLAREKQGINLPLERRPILEVMTGPDSGVTPMPGVTEASGQTMVRVPAP